MVSLLPLLPWGTGEVARASTDRASMMRVSRPSLALFCVKEIPGFFDLIGWFISTDFNLKRKSDGRKPSIWVKEEHS
jgi:hypothetical protein